MGLEGPNYRIEESLGSRAETMEGGRGKGKGGWESLGRKVWVCFDRKEEQKIEKTRSSKRWGLRTFAGFIFEGLG